MEGLVAHLRADLRDRYDIEEELGHGGMGCVYKARDLRHSRTVALKVLYPHLTSSSFIERFFREIGIAARLSHPHILPLHDSGESGGCLFYVMPFVPGETLRVWLRREPQLPIETAVRLAQEIADALAYAHREGVVHRDIKPENILISEGHAVLGDFGIAMAVAGDLGTLTAPGSVMGTPVYMSPEQATGDVVDGRSDIYSLGCVLYEMLAGEPPFVSASPQMLIARHAAEPVRDLGERRPDIPSHLSSVVARALAKQPADRFPTADLFGRALSGEAGPVTRARGGSLSRGLRVAVVVASLAGALFLGRWLYVQRVPFHAELRLIDARPVAGTSLTMAELDKGVPLHVVVEQRLRNRSTNLEPELGLWVQLPCDSTRQFSGGCWSVTRAIKVTAESTQLGLDDTLHRANVVKDTVFVRIAISLRDSDGSVRLYPGRGTILLLYPVRVP